MKFSSSPQRRSFQTDEKTHLDLEVDNAENVGNDFYFWCYSSELTTAMHHLITY